MFRVTVKDTGEIIYEESEFYNGEDWLYNNFVHKSDVSHDWIMADWWDVLQDVELWELDDEERSEYESAVDYYELMNSLTADDIEIAFANEYHERKGYSLDSFFEYIDHYHQLEDAGW